MRSLLFAPANRPDMVAKLPRAEPDAVVVDLEDAVPPDGKAAARAGLAEALAPLPDDLHVCVRVNPVGTEWFADDLAAVPEGVTVVVPKVERPSDLEPLVGRDVIAGIETARGVLEVRALLDGPVIGAYFGAEDYVADLGGVRTAHSTEVLYARSRVALACRVHGVHALDQVVVDVRDDDAFRADARTGRELGYGGKLCVHPGQVPLAHAAFTPSAEEVARAEAILATEGQGVAVVDGAMVDQPMLRAARDILNRSMRGDP